MAWKVREQEELIQTIPFNVEEVIFEHKGEDTHKYHRLICSDWVTIIPITKENKAVLIKQYRAGELNFVLEAPGGAVDYEEDPIKAAHRELEEETGYQSEQIIKLMSINPNPALFNNRIHIYLAQKCELAQPRKHFPDSGEEIDIEVYSQEELEDLVRSQKINHALSALGVMLSLKYL